MIDDFYTNPDIIFTQYQFGFASINEAEQEALGSAGGATAGAASFSGPSSGGGPGIPVGCFIGETLVMMADRSEMRIDRIRPGHMVTAFDSNGILWPAKVLNVFPKKVFAVDTLYFENACPVTGTEIHPFWQKGRKFAPAHSIKYSVTYGDAGWGDSPVTERRTLHFEEGVWVYNLEVAVYRTYIAGGHGVHNRKDAPPE